MTAPLTAGRDLDALVAERVFGCKVKWPPSIQEPGISQTEYERRRNLAQEPECGCSPLNADHETLDDEYQSSTPHYSTDIAAAWQIVEKLRERGHSVSVFSGATGGGHYVELHGVAGWHGPIKGDSAPHAICLAALAALRATEDK
jgi:hypothetical protein